MSAIALQAFVCASAALGRPHATTLDHPCAHTLVRYERFDRLRPGLLILDGKVDRSICRQLAGGRNVARQHGDPCRQCLEHRQSESLGDARKAQADRALIQGGERRVAF